MPVQPDEEEYREWLTHPVTEWVFACMKKQAEAQKAKWADMAWKGDLDPLLLKEAQVRADDYLALPESSFEDWKAIDDTES